MLKVSDKPAAPSPSPMQAVRTKKEQARIDAAIEGLHRMREEYRRNVVAEEPSPAAREKKQRDALARVDKEVKKVLRDFQKNGATGNPLADAVLEDRWIMRAFADGKIGKDLSPLESHLEERRVLRELSFGK